MERKRHHFVPRVYLNCFCNQVGNIYVYQKDNPTKNFCTSPNNIAVEKYYYSQPLPEGEKDHNSLEDLFSQVEASYGKIVKKMCNRENISKDMDALFKFIVLQFARVPSNRDSIEQILTETVRMSLQILDEKGQLPEKPLQLKNVQNLFDEIKISINPHKSLQAMPDIIKAVGMILSRIGFRILCNTTDISFLTSDNPVIWFNPSVKEENRLPYACSTEGPVEFLFPVTPQLLLHGHSKLLKQDVCSEIKYEETFDRQQIKKFNRLICKHAYKMLYSPSTEHEKLIQKYANISPVFEPNIITSKRGKILVIKKTFGKMLPKTKWDE
jgi:hypothetical protein